MDQQALRRWLINRINGERLLDYGTFAGQLGPELASAGKQVTLWLAPDKLEETTFVEKAAYNETKETPNKGDEESPNEGAVRLYVYGGAPSPLFYGDAYFETIIFNLADWWPLDAPLLPLVQEWERLLVPNGRLLIICPTAHSFEDGKNGHYERLTAPIMAYFALLQEVAQRFYLKEVEIKQGYFRGVALKRYRQRSRLADDDWRRLVEFGLYNGSIADLQERLWQKELELNTLLMEKKELEEQLAQYESSLLGKASLWLNRNGSKRNARGSSMKDGAAFHGKMDRHSTERVSTGSPSTQQPTGKPEPSRGNGILINPVQVSPPSETEPLDREQQVAEAWHTYTQRLRQLNPTRWVMILSTPTYFQSSLHSRSLQLAEALQNEGTPVVLICEEHATGQNLIPAYTGSTTFQLPRDLFEHKVHQWLDAEVGSGEKVLVFTQPDWLAAKLLNLAKIKGWRTIYDVALDWESFSAWGKLPVYSTAVEHYLLHHADLVTTVSEGLKEKIKAFRGDTGLLVVPNGPGKKRGWSETEDRFTSGPSVKSGSGMKSGSGSEQERVLIGYWGPLEPPWIDWNILFSVAKQRPAWRFELLEAPLQLGGLQEQMRVSLDLKGDRLQLPGWPSNITVYRKRNDLEGLKLASRWHSAFYPFLDRHLALGSDLPTLKHLLNRGLAVVALGPDPAHRLPGYYIAHHGAEALAMLERIIQTGAGSESQTGVKSEHNAVSPGDWLAAPVWTFHLKDIWNQLHPSPSIGSFFNRGEDER